MTRIEVVLKDMGVRENGAKVQVTLEYSPACPKISLLKRCL